MERSFTKIRDVDLKILSELNDEDLLNTCKIENRYIQMLCHDENFWRTRFIKTFGESGKNRERIWRNRFIKFFGESEKNRERSWRNFYLKILYYDNTFHAAQSLLEVSKGGMKNLDLIIFFMDKVTDYYKNIIDDPYFRNAALTIALEGASLGGDQELVELLISQGARDFNQGMASAAQGGHYNLVQFFINKGANQWDRGLNGAIKSGNNDLIKFFIDKGANDWVWAEDTAEEEGREDLVKYFKDLQN